MHGFDARVSHHALDPWTSARQDVAQEDTMILAGPHARRLGAYHARMIAGDLTAVDDHFAPGFRSHVTARVDPSAETKDLRLVEAEYFRAVRAAMPDAAFRVDVLVERDDLLVSNWTIEGTHTGAPLFGAPPTNARRVINGTAIMRFENGKIAEHWGGPHCPFGIGVALPGAAPDDWAPGG
jgi:predicted ester cyclase